MAKEKYLNVHDGEIVVGTNYIDHINELKEIRAAVLRYEKHCRDNGEDVVADAMVAIILNPEKVCTDIIVDY